ncbi:MAG TPA: class I SAM-dependent methyltransferase, partial [Phycisphaerae bacterium]|nr:class I SAM-dependent methyltransferase [Phycisphaerae bacterium]
MACRVNIGCGNAPTVGESWKNYDNSLSIVLAKWPTEFIRLLRKIRVLSSANVDAIAGYKKFGSLIRRADCTKLPLTNDSVDVVYTSHMFEHLSKAKAERFLREAYR